MSEPTYAVAEDAATRMLADGQELIDAAEEAFAQIACGELETDHARWVFHKLGPCLDLALACAKRPLFEHWREGFEQLAARIVTLREQARETF